MTTTSIAQVVLRFTAQLLVFFLCTPAAMIRRLTSRLSKDKKQEINGNGVADTKKAVNGTSSSHATKSKKEDPVDHSASRHEVESSFSKFGQLIHASQRPLPTQTGDGAYLDHTEPSGLLHDLKTIGFKDVNTLMQVMRNKATGELQDDKTYMMEHVIQLVSDLPSMSKTRVDLTNAFIDELWNSLQHPPMTYLGDTYTYRSADGSYNNPVLPMLGAANTPYARSVNPNSLQPGALPEPGLVFDSVMAREKFTPHPNKVSSVFFYWASLIIHDLFQTDHRDFNMSQTSSYLDLSTLYGDTQEDQDQIRTFKDGKLKPDCFAEPRLLGFPPGCGVLLIMLNRFHNYVVEQLAVINENGRFTKPSEGLSHEYAEKSWAKYDNDLFQTGRLIVCGLYIVQGHGGTPSGVGNQVSAEFNLAYRWHSAISEKDEKWTEGLYRELFGKDAADVSLPELLQGLGKWEQGLDKDPQKRPFAHLQRGPDGKYPDDGLVDILTSSVEDVAGRWPEKEGPNLRLGAETFVGAFGANNIPKCLKAVTILGMQQARKWNLASLNEFRQFFQLKTYDTFEEINSDPVVADQLRYATFND
ncbi:MAG: hypothetical protein Q9191_000438 [Dirinaria sp. TL-2023a]